MNYFDDLNDPLDDLLGAPMRPVPAKPVSEIVERAAFVEQCPRCQGSGRFRNFGPCFACKGAGSKTFKTSTADRAANRQKATERKFRAEADNAAEFAKEFPAEAAWMVANKPRFDFAAKMLDAVTKYGHLTENQMAAVRKCITRDEQRKVERDNRIANAKTVDASKITQAFAHARTNAARPGMKGVWMRPLPMTSGEATGKQTVVFEFGKGKWDGFVFVMAHGTDKKLGMIREGKFLPRFQCSEAEEAAIIECASDPLNAAKAFGKAWGKCCVCSRTLTNDESIAGGIGPVCASKFGW